MNSKIYEAAEEVALELQNNEFVKEYFKLKKLVDSNKELEKLRTEISDLKMKCHSNEEKYAAEVKLLKEKYDSHPLITNLNLIREEVYNLLKQVEESIK